MNIKLRVSEVIPVLDRRFAIDQVYKQIGTFAKQSQLLFAEPQTGAGYLQWSLSGNDWTAFTKADDDTKSAVAQHYQQRRQQMFNALQGSPMRDAILTFPSEDFIYFRPSAGGFDIAITGWGFKYPDRPGGGELDTWIKRSTLQMVNIAFSWDEQPLPNIAFRLAGQPRTTATDGFFRFDRPIPVGTSYPLELSTGEKFTLTVEQDRSDYIFDLTQYMQVEIDVAQDGMPAANKTCNVSFGTKNLSAETNEAGHASLRIPLVCDTLLQLQVPQPSCNVSCDAQSEEKTPTYNGEILHFQFLFETPKPEPVPEPEPEPEPDPVPEPEPEPEPEAEPEFISFQLLDYGGYPLPNMPFTLKLKLKGEQQLVTDEEGYCEVPKEWFTHKEKMTVKFSVTPEYQAEHDLHDRKDAKKKK